MKWKMNLKKRWRIKKERRKIIIGASIIILAVAAILFFAIRNNIQKENSVPPQNTPGTSANSASPSNSGHSSSGNNQNNNPASSQPKYEPLNSSDAQKVASIILSSEFIKSVPQKYPISLTFYKFENGQRIWQDSFLIGNNQLLTSGTPAVSLTMSSKYISQLNSTNLCDVIKQANKNGDLGFQSSYSTASLLIKYIGLLKYRDCFGF